MSEQTKASVTICESFQDGTVVVRKARKKYYCHGGHKPGVGRTKCDAPIEPGTIYVEYLGETPPWQSGYRYHPECASQQGLVYLVAAGAPT